MAENKRLASRHSSHYHQAVMVESANPERIRLAKEALLGRLLPGLIHQLRNPLNSILTSAELLDAQGEDAQLRGTLLPVVSRSALRIRDLLRPLDSSLDSDPKRVFDLRGAVNEAKELLQCHQRIVAIHTPKPGPAIVIKGDYESLWILLLGMLEECFCAAKTSIWIEIADNGAQVEVSVKHDGTIEATNSGLLSEFILALAPALGAAVYYKASEQTAVLSFARALQPKGQKP